MVIGLTTCILVGCRQEQVREDLDWKQIRVVATAYNSVSWQTGPDPNLTAWGDTLRPGMRCIAVSRDLIPKGLKHNTMVKIPGLEGLYLVKDKMHRKWRHHIDIYMGDDIAKAKEWGRQRLWIQFGVSINDSVISPGKTAATP